MIEIILTYIFITINQSQIFPDPDHPRSIYNDFNTMCKAFVQPTHYPSELEIL